MAQLTRSTKIGGGTVLQANTLARAIDVETDILTLFNAHNNHDAGTSKWQVGSFENATSTVVIANNSTGTNNILEARDNGTAVHTIADGGDQTFTGKMLGPDGTASLPTYSFASANNNDNGLYLAAANNPAISAGGTKRLDISTTAITAALNIAMGGTNKITGLAAGSAAGDSVRFEQLKVFQTVWATNSTAFTTTSSTYQTSNCSVSITPTSASNKVLVFAIGGIRNNVVEGTTVSCSIFRDATDTISSAATIGINSATVTGNNTVPATLISLDSPASTSAITYSVKVKNGNGSTTVGFGGGNLTVIVAMEVA